MLDAQALDCRNWWEGICSKMRGVLFALAAMIVMGLGYWAYKENYRTQEALRIATSLQREIGSSRETLSVLQAEWAYLNRPERLRDLAALNFEQLQLLPISAEHFGAVSQVAYPRAEVDLPIAGVPIDVIGLDPQAAPDGEQYP